MKKGKISKEFLEFIYYKEMIHELAKKIEKEKITSDLIKKFKKLDKALKKIDTKKLIEEVVKVVR